MCRRRPWLLLSHQIRHLESAVEVGQELCEAEVITQAVQVGVGAHQRGKTVEAILRCPLQVFVVSVGSPA